MTPDQSPAPPSQPPVYVEHPSGPLPLPGPPRPPASRLWIVAAAGGLVVGVAVGAIATAATTSSSSSSSVAAPPPATRTVTVTASPTAPPSAPVPAQETATPTAVGAPQRALGAGTYEVGTGPGQAAPGKYKSTGPDSSFGGCYYARLKDNDGSLGDIIDNNISQGPSVFTIKPSDGYVEISGCTFTRS
jgi:hypothetical protein